MKPIHRKIQSLLEQLCAEGRERGIQVAAYHRGELIVDASAGVADVRSGSAVTSATLFPVFSMTKGLFATVIHALVDRGRFNYDTCVARCGRSLPRKTRSQ
jgi:CubicO group peptidase (beta-lactamase class C family)